MRRKAILMFCFLCLSPGFGRASNLDEAWRRVFAVESSNGQDPRAFVENHARALGIAQITPVMVRDVNRILRAPVFSLDDRLDWAASREMFRVAQEHYNRGESVETMCRFWLRGPSRKRQYDKHGDEYWAACQRKVGTK